MSELPIFDPESHSSYFISLGLLRSRASVRFVLTLCEFKGGRSVRLLKKCVQLCLIVVAFVRIVITWSKFGKSLCYY